MTEKINETLTETVNEEGKAVVSYFWKGLALFLLGVVVGFAFAPVKKGVKICTDNGNNNTFEGNDTAIFSDDKADKEEEE